MKDYFKVLSVEGSDSADILLYGVIGQDFWWDEELNEESITDVAFVKTLKELEQKYSRINIRINSPGGSMYHGNAIVTAIQSSSAEIHAYNDGMAASMAADIWLASPNRHMAKNSLLMIHSPSSMVWGTAGDMRKEADVLDKFEHTAIAVMADTTDLTEEEIKEQFYDHEDHWLTAKEAAEMNLITEVEDYEVEGVPTNVTSMNLQDIMKHFEQKDDKEATGLVQKIKDKWATMFSRRMSANILPKIEIDMKSIDDIMKEVKAGNLNAVDLQDKITQHLASIAPKKEDTPPAAADATKTVEEMKAMVQKALAPVQARITAQEETIEKQAAEIVKLKGAPATPPVKGEGGEDDDPLKQGYKGNDERLKELNAHISTGRGFSAT